MAQDEDRKVDLEKALGTPPVDASGPPDDPAATSGPPDDDVRYARLDAEEADAGPDPVAEPAPDAAHAHDATEEVTVTRPTEAPLPDDTGLANAFSPVDLPQPAEPLERPLAWTSVVIATSFLLLALFNAHAIRGWAYELPAGPVSARIVAVAEGWHDITDGVGLTAPGAALRGLWEKAQAARFTSTPPVGANEAEAAAPEGTGNTQR